ncbi:hypothetical protein F5Y16DRAFT_392615 [Xylariaceae sp. FL0255]|nr:hypothetical protein F5Y16DRAFT_392615 [Xylariaceae sp. FL0255]
MQYPSPESAMMHPSNLEKIMAISAGKPLHTDPAPDNDPQHMQYDDSTPPLSPSTTEERSGLSKRDRNRIAAAKCRNKARRTAKQLQERERSLLEENTALSAEKIALRRQVVELKEELLQHGNCDDDMIQLHLWRSAAILGEEYRNGERS